MRTALIKVLGADYLGLSNYIASVLQVLNMAELGLSSAIVFSLYKPIADNNMNLIRALLMFYRRAYRIIGASILIVGGCVAPFIPTMISGGYPDNINIFIVYGLYLINTSVSYFVFAYKNALITAAQRQDVLTNINSIVVVLKYSVQIIVLIVFGNFYAFIFVEILATIASNVLVQISSRRLFPEIECDGDLALGVKRTIIQQVKGLAVGQITKATRNSLDNVFLAAFCGLIDVAIYSNYYYVMTSVLGCITLLTQAMLASVGNSITVESLDKNYQDFKKFYYAFSMIGAVAFACLFSLYQPFMNVWVGDDLTASHLVMILFCIYFYITQMGQVRSMYASAAGLWWEFRWLNILEAVANLLLNAVLGFFMGMAGILIATISTVFIFSIVGVTIKTFRLLFQRSSKGFWLNSVAYAFIAALMSVASYFACSFVLDLSWQTLFLRLFICLIVSCMIALAASMGNATLRAYLKGIIKSLRHG